MKKREQMGDKDSTSCDRSPSPSSQHDNYKRARQRSTGEFTSNASQV